MSVDLIVSLAGRRTYHWVQASRRSRLGHSSPYDDEKIDEDEGEVKVN